MGLLELVVFGGGVPLFSLLFLGLARRGGSRLVDDPRDAPERKLQATAVPLIGGPALFATGLVYFVLAQWIGSGPADRGAALLLSKPVGLALVGAFLVGLFDDIRDGGFGAGAKLLLQFCAAAPLYTIVPGIEGGALVVAGVVAMNALNTFDNADGAVTGLMATTLAPIAPGLGLGMLAFLPFNIGARPARAYLGDSGSHMLGMLLLFLPGAWLALFLPAIDLARVIWLRLRAGEAIWVGDRRHLAHRMETYGWSAWRVMLSQVAIAAPAIFLGTSGLVFEDLAATIVCLGASFGLFVAAVIWTRPASPGGARPI